MPTPDLETAEASKGSNGGLIGGVIGALLVFFVVVTIVLCCVYKQRTTAGGEKKEVLELEELTPSPLQDQEISRTILDYSLPCDDLVDVSTTQSSSVFLPGRPDMYDAPSTVGPVLLAPTTMGPFSLVTELSSIHGDASVISAKERALFRWKNWEMHQNEDLVPYYYNCVTEESLWDPPPGWPPSYRLGRRRARH
jgi:hypothetical protein